jgi:histidine triad (HIT) family protein
VSTDCLFCRIVAGEIPAAKVHEDELIVAIRDRHPVAPVHLLLMPRAHIEFALDLTEVDAPIAGRLLATAAALARSEGIADGGFRLVVNAGVDGGQTVGHLHVHLLGGRAMQWPPG